MISQPNTSELFLGIVAPIGTDLALIVSELRQALEKVNYTSDEVHVIDLLHELKPWEVLKELRGEERYRKHIDAGRQFCDIIERDNALAALAMSRVKKLRASASTAEANNGEPPPPRVRHAYIFRSLKRPAEIKTLREVYGDAFWLIAANSRRDDRVRHLASDFAEGAHGFDPDLHRGAAESLIEVDENEAQNVQIGSGQEIHFGQNVRSAFPLADVFVDTADHKDLKYQIQRFVRILFQYQFNTPTRDEYGMALARLASLRSADLARQVGAAIALSDGTVIALGTNEVPRSGGGLYWPNDKPDKRDFQLKKNVSYKLRRRVLADVIRRLSQAKRLDPDWKKRVDENLAAAVDEALKDGVLRESRIMDTIEFGRTVHAEMAAITDAARHGTATAGSTLFTTTFPCHDCARHIVAAGIRRVVYIEPYPKSLATELYGDSVVVDVAPECFPERVHFQPFVGISPDRYNVLFRMSKRKGHDDKVGVWDKRTAQPRLSGNPAHYLLREKEEVDWLDEDMKSKGLNPVE